jgi:hypothetical protein
VTRENHGAGDVPALDVIVMATALQEHFYLRFLKIKKSEGASTIFGNALHPNYVKTLLQGSGTTSCYGPAISKELFDMPLQPLVPFMGT